MRAFEDDLQIDDQGFSIETNWCNHAKYSDLICGDQLLVVLFVGWLPMRVKSIFSSIQVLLFIFVCGRIIEKVSLTKSRDNYLE